MPDHEGAPANNRPLDSIADKVLEAFIEVMTRLRWFLLTTVLISSLILAHVYLERFSHTDKQLKGVIATRIANKTLEKLACMEAVVKKLREDVMPKDCENVSAFYSAFIDLEANERLARYASLKIGIDRTSNTLKEIQLSDRNVPFLGWNIPANDYLPIMAVMLTIFCVGVWLNIRSLLAALKALSQLDDGSLMRLARLHFTFTGLMQQNDGDKAAKFVRWLALWLPSGALFIGVLVDLGPVLLKVLGLAFKHGYFGESSLLILRSFILLGLLIVILAAAAGSARLTSQIDSLVRQKSS